MPLPDLVIFDCDGVLVDSEPIANRVFRDMLNELGMDVTLEFMFEHFVGLSMPQCVELITSIRGAPPPPQFLEVLRARTEQALRAEVTPVPGIPAVLQTMEVPFCVASSGAHAKIRLTLGATGLLDHFADRIFSVADVAAPKPAPDLFLFAAQRMGKEPAHCVVVEDTPTGVRAGVAAGMRVLGFCRHTPAARLLDAGARIVFDDMTRLPQLLHESF